MKKTGTPRGDFEGQICPLARLSCKKRSSSFCLDGDKGKVQDQGMVDPRVSSMAWSQGFWGGSVSKLSLEKTSRKSWYISGTRSSKDQSRASLVAWIVMSASSPSAKIMEGMRKIRLPGSTEFMWHWGGSVTL